MHLFGMFIWNVHCKATFVYIQKSSCHGDVWILFVCFIFQGLADKLRPMIVDTIQYLNKAIDSGKTVLVEGAQSNVLDIDFGELLFIYLFVLFWLL